MSRVISDKFRGGIDALDDANKVVRKWQDKKVNGTLAQNIRSRILSRSAVKEDHVSQEYIDGYNEVLYFLLNSPGFPDD